MDATEKLRVFLVKLSICKKSAEADILAHFQMLEEMLYQDGSEIQNSLFPSNGKSVNIWKYFRTHSKCTSTLMASKLN
jgi:monomeric isocitrate dehydrogenase